MFDSLFLFSHCIVSRTVFPEYHGDPTAGFGLVFHANVGVVPLGNLVCDEQAQSRALGIGGSAGGVETVKHIGQLFFRNTGSGIGNSEHTGRSSAAQVQIYGAVFRGKFDGIIQQNQHQLPDSAIAPHTTHSMPLKLANLPMDKKYMRELMDMLGILDKRNRLPNQLSGGQ